MTTEDLQGQVARSAAVERELREEIGKLRAELAEVRQSWGEDVDRLVDARNRATAAESALAKYGKHIDGCHLLECEGCGKPASLCDCGFDAALARAGEQGAPQPPPEVMAGIEEMQRHPPLSVGCGNPATWLAGEPASSGQEGRMVCTACRAPLIYFGGGWRPPPLESLTPEQLAHHHKPITDTEIRAALEEGERDREALERATPRRPGTLTATPPPGEQGKGSFSDRAMRCVGCGKVGRRKWMRPAREGWLYIEVRDDEDGDSVIEWACSRACADAQWKAGPGERLATAAAEQGKGGGEGLRVAHALLTELRHELLRVDGRPSESLAELPATLRRASTVARASAAIRAIEDAEYALALLAPAQPAAHHGDAITRARAEGAAEMRERCALALEHPALSGDLPFVEAADVVREVPLPEGHPAQMVTCSTDTEEHHGPHRLRHPTRDEKSWCLDPVPVEHPASSVIQPAVGPAQDGAGADLPRSGIPLIGHDFQANTWPAVDAWDKRVSDDPDGPSRQCGRPRREHREPEGGK